MPYCPKCDMEFVDGITVCTDCGGPLVESEEAARAMKAARREQEAARERAMYRALAEEYGGQPEEYDSRPEEGGPGPKDAQRYGRTGVYEDKARKYSDLRSSASAFLIVGCGLAVLSVLLWTGAIRLPVAPVSRAILQGALSLMAVLSLIVSFRTGRDARELAPQIEEEKQRTGELIRWFTERYSAESIDGEIPDADTLSPEERSLKRFQLIQDHLVTGRDLPDPAYVDALSEELYGKLFEP